MRNLLYTFGPVSGLVFFILVAVGFGSKIHHRHEIKKQKKHYEKKMEKYKKEEEEYRNYIKNENIEEKDKTSDIYYHSILDDSPDYLTPEEREYILRDFEDRVQLKKK